MNDALPTREQLLKDPIREKFVFLTSDKHPQTCIGLTDKTDFHGVVYKYGKVSIPEELPDINSENNLNLKFEYDILENNGISREKFGDEFFKLIGDILYHIIVVQTPEGTNEPNDRENDTKQLSIQWGLL